MKNSVLWLVGLLLLVSVSSCEKCIKCQILGKNYQDTLFQDTVKIIYPEFCGTPSEVSAFESDVEFAANNRKCVTYSIRKIEDNSALVTSTVCGGTADQERALEILDSLVQVVYANVDVALIVDTVRANPGKWECK
jgi:hypothetical protein